MQSLPGIACISTEHSPFWEYGSCLTGQEILRLLWNLKDDYLELYIYTDEFTPRPNDAVPWRKDKR